MSQQHPTKPAPARPAAMLDPDVRFLLANERTLLAWIRTALALMAGGLALTQFGQKSALQVSFGIAAILLGALMAVAGYIRFKAADRAIRAGRLPAAGHGPTLQVMGVIISSLVIASVELATLAHRP
ncbi:MAG TPA: DUF202 domain-containing protein [Candidatus Saccharimonadales bacterium]|nr:DUF202 domain-containing protein [Candidatus Saccharimonadales bacterium]